MNTEACKVFKKATGYTYRILFDENIANPKKEVTPFSLNEGGEAAFTYMNIRYSVVLKEMQFERKLYQPGQITAEIHVMRVDKEAGTAWVKNDAVGKDEVPLPLKFLRELLLQRRVTMLISPKDADQEVVVAENYYVHEITPKVIRTEADAWLSVKLTICSMDKLMTLDKYSKAYVAKKLGSEILTSESKIFGYQDGRVKIYTENMQRLKYQDASVVDNVTVNILSEFVQPYLVQYNESFYDFMARTANRCGEFLFFENGQLILGLPKKDQDEPISIDNYETISYQNTSAAPLNIKDYVRDSVKGSKELRYNDDSVELDSTGYPVGAFGKDLSYNAELSHDDFIFPMIKDKFTDYWRVIGAPDVQSAITKVSLDVFSNIVSNTSDWKQGLKNIGTNLGTQYSLALYAAKGTAADNNSKGNKVWMDGYKGKPQTNGTRTVPFATVKEESWLKLAYYSETRREEESQLSKMVCIDMGTACLPVKLGDTVTIGRLEGKYVIVEIRQNINTKHLQTICAVPVIMKDGGEELIIPPLLQASPIRKSGPQTAFVVANNDPKNQGRVRIAYPWQAVGDQTRRLELAEAKATFDEKNAVFKKAEEKQVSIEAKIKHLKQQNKALASVLSQMGYDAEKKDENIPVVAKAEDKDTFDRCRQICNQSRNDNLEKITKLKRELDPAIDGSTVSKIEAHEKTRGKFLIPGLMPLTAVAAVELAIVKLKSDKAKYEEELKKRKADEELNKDVCEELNSFERSNTPSPAKFLLDRYTERKDNEITPQEKELKKAEKETEKAKKEKDVANGELKKLSLKWKDQLLELASPWVRVSMPMATAEGGVFFRPQEGDEVLVNYDSDNVERPYVAGSLYSKEHLDPGGKMVIKSPSGQKISFNVAKDDSDFVSSMAPFLDALQKYIPGMPKLTLGDAARKLCGGITLTDEFGMFSVDMSSTKRAVSIKSPYGNVSVSAFSGISISAPNGDVKIEGKNVTISAGNNLSITSGTNVTPENSKDDSKEKDKKEDEKKKKGEVDPASVKLYEVSKKQKAWNLVKKGWNLGWESGLPAAQSKVQEKTGGLLKGLQVVDVALLRSLFDVFLRPIEGTLCVKSNNYLKLEAGKGKAEISVERYNKKWQELKGIEKDADRQMFFAKMTAYIKRIDSKVGRFCDDYMNLKKDAVEKKHEYGARLDYFWNPDVEKPKFMEAAFKLGDNEFKKNDAEYKGGTVDLSVIKLDNIKEKGDHAIYVPKVTILHTLKGVKEYINPSAEAYCEAAWGLQRKARAYTTCFSDDTVKAVNKSVFGTSKHPDTEWIDKCFMDVICDKTVGELVNTVSDWESRFGRKGSEPTEAFLGHKAVEDKKDVFADPKLLKRRMVAKFLLKVYSAEGNQIKLTGAAAALSPVPVQGKYFQLSYTTQNEIDNELLMKNWDVVASLDVKKSKRGFWAKILKFLDDQENNWIGVRSSVKKSWSPFFDSNKPKWYERRVWNDKGGKIIFSDTKGATYGFNGENIEKWKQAGLDNIENLKKAISGI